MGRYKQTLFRIGVGLSAMAALAVLIWPSDFSFIKDKPVEIFAFLTTLCVWVFSEFHTSEEVVIRQSSPNDIRLSREIISTKTGKIGFLLSKHNIWSPLPEEYYDEIDVMVYKIKSGEIMFQNKRLNPMLLDFSREVENFYTFVFNNVESSDELGRDTVGFKPLHTVSEEHYRHLLDLSKKADDRADRAFSALENLIEAIYKEVPEALDEPISPS